MAAWHLRAHHAATCLRACDQRDPVCRRPGYLAFDLRRHAGLRGCGFLTGPASAVGRGRRRRARPWPSDRQPPVPQVGLAADGHREDRLVRAANPAYWPRCQRPGVMRGRACAGPHVTGNITIGGPAAIFSGKRTNIDGRRRPVEDAVNVSTPGGSGHIVVAGAGYAGLHVALRLTAKLRNHPMVELTLVDRHDYHQALTELPRVAGGTRAADAVRIPLQEMLAERAGFVQAEITGFDLAGRRLLTGAGPIGWNRLVLALGSRPNDFAIPGLAERALSLYSANDAEQVWAAVNRALTAAAAASDPERQRRLATVVVGGGGATGVELAV